MDVSVVVPVLNEEENVEELVRRIHSSLSPTDLRFEVLIVDDGSTDRTVDILRQLQPEHPSLRVVKLRKNYGQTPAMKAGIDHARGDVIVTMDGDLQNDPADIPQLVERLGDDYDLVTGWRKRRKDPFLTRKVPSKVANWIIWKLTGVRIHDNGCSLKAYRAEVIKQTPLYSDLHRFIPAMMSVAGSRIAEVPVNHHPRQRGASKYGLSRIGKVLMDMTTVKMLVAFQERPLHWFGILSLPLGLLTLLVSLLFLLGDGTRGGVTVSLVVLGASLFLHFVTMGLLAELVVNTGRPYAYRSMSRTTHGKRS